MKKLITICVVIAVLFAATIEVHAATYGITSRADLAADDSVDWGQQGYGTPVNGGGHLSGWPYVRIPVPAFSEGGIGLNVTNPPYNGSILSMSIRQQSLSWFGNFAPGDVLINNQWDVSGFITGPAPDYMITNIGPGPMTIHFDVPVYGLGAQVNKWQYFAGTFNAIIEAFDSNWNSLGQVSFNNLQFTRVADNSAPFIGILSDTADISHVVIATGRSALIINKLDLVTVAPTIPGTAIPSSPGTVGGVALVIKGANANDPVTPDTTAGAMLVNNETYLNNSEYIIADLSVDSVVQTSAFTGEINYNGNSLVSFRLPVNPIIWGDYALLPIDVQIDGAPASLTDLDGQVVKTLRVVLNRGSGFIPELNDYHQTFQYLVSATLSNNNGGGNGNGGNGGNGGGQQTATPVEFEGSIDSIAAADNALEVTVGNVTLTVDSQTTITVNGQPAVFGDLQAGYKVAGMYDSSNNHAIEIKAEGNGGGGNGGGNGGGGNGGGGQQTAKPKKIEGFIDSIAAVADALEVTVGKEGNFVTVTVDSQTSIIINEQPASMNDLQAGDKAKGKYDSANNHATEIMVEGG